MDHSEEPGPLPSGDVWAGALRPGVLWPPVVYAHLVGILGRREGPKVGFPGLRFSEQMSGLAGCRRVGGGLLSSGFSLESWRVSAGRRGAAELYVSRPQAGEESMHFGSCRCLWYPGVAAGPWACQFPSQNAGFLIAV